LLFEARTDWVAARTVELQKHNSRFGHGRPRAEYHPFVDKLHRALHVSLGAVWITCKTSRSVQVALLLGLIPFLCVLFGGIYINFNRTKRLVGIVANVWAILFPPFLVGRVQPASKELVQGVRVDRSIARIVVPIRVRNLFEKITLSSS
jgi:hypothetical protein